MSLIGMMVKLSHADLRPEALVVYSFGRRDQLDIEALQRLVNSISRFFSPYVRITTVFKI